MSSWSDVEARLAKLGVRAEDLEESFLRSGGSGGQNINKVETAVLLVHRPSGLFVRCQEARSQGQNRLIARLRLAEKLEDAARARAAARRHADELARRRSRGRSRRAKARMLDDKRHRAGVKNRRGRVRGDE